MSSFAPLASVKPCSKEQISDKQAIKFLLPVLSKLRTKTSSINKKSPKAFKVDSIDAIYVDNALSDEECGILRNLIDNTESNNSDLISFWNPVGRDNDDARSFRDCNTIEINCKEFGDLLWNRVKNYVDYLLKPIIISDKNDNNEDIETEMIGTWNAVTTNNDILLAKYPRNGHFAPHTDGRATHLFNRRSLYSIIVFLNDIPLEEGGGTRFYSNDAVTKLHRDINNRWTSDRSLMTAEIEACAGRMLIFEQSLVHEGVPSLVLPKYIIRSDVIFDRNPPINVNEEAFSYYRKAEEVAEDGQVEESIRLFKKAFAMDKKLKEIMKQ